MGRDIAAPVITRDTVAVETNPRTTSPLWNTFVFHTLAAACSRTSFASAVFAPIVPAGLKMVAVGFFLLAAYVTFDAIKTLIEKEQLHPESHKLVFVWNVSACLRKLTA